MTFNHAHREPKTEKLVPGNKRKQDEQEAEEKFRQTQITSLRKSKGNGISYLPAEHRLVCDKKDGSLYSPS